MNKKRKNVFYIYGLFVPRIVTPMDLKKSPDVSPWPVSSVQCPLESSCGAREHRPFVRNQPC